MEEIFELIRQERKRQDKKWGKIPRELNIHKWMSVLTEEVGEVAESLLKREDENTKIELVQVAAVCVAFLEELNWFDSHGHSYEDN
jgi:NTP pyrophosphatase (non-canonical NTP hydrolase)